MATYSGSTAQKIAKTGASAILAISSFSPSLGGTVGRAVDVVGKALGNPLPEYGATEKAQSAGGQPTASMTPAQRTALEQQAKTTAGFPSAAGVTQQRAVNVSTPSSGQGNFPSQNPNSVGATTSEKSQGANVGDIRDFGGQAWRWDGGQWTIEGGGSSDTGGKVLGLDVANKLGQDNTAALKSQLNLDDQGLNDYLQKVADDQRGSAEDIANNILNTATANANAEYNAVLDALRVQKGEAETLGEKQRGRAKEEATIGEAELTSSEEKGVKDIESEKEGFVKESEKNKEMLARNWRDLSLEIQRVMRARGVQDSSYSADKESKLLLNFNKGLQTIAVESQDALKDFSDAVIETKDFYSREKNKLDFQLRGQLEDIDTFVRQTIQSVQAQEGVALAQKFAAINNAVKDANNLKKEVEMKIQDREAGLATWMAQAQTQYKYAVATAAQQSVGSARQSISNIATYNKMIMDGLDSGQLEIQKVQLSNGQSQYVAHGSIGGNEITEPLSNALVENQQNTQALQLATNVGKAATALYGSDPLNKDRTNYVNQALGISTPQQAISTPEKKLFGIF